MSEYIMDLRKIVGHRTLIQCGAGVIIVNNVGEIRLDDKSKIMFLAFELGLKIME